MTIDERLEALTQAVELMASMQKDHEARMEKERAEDLARMSKLEVYFGRMMQSITRLSNITAVHEIHLNDHEHRVGDLETGR
jgi:hypothetical protein